MGEIKQGIDGAVLGKVGSHVGSTWKGIPTLSGYVGYTNQTITSNVINNRSSFANCRKALSVMRNMLFPFALNIREGKLPKWPLWIKKTSYTFPAEKDWSVKMPLITFNEKIKSPAPFHYAWGYEGDNVAFAVDYVQQYLDLDYKLYFFAYDYERDEIILELSSSNLFVPFFVARIPQEKVLGRKFAIMCFYLKNERYVPAGLSGGIAITIFA